MVLPAFAYTTYTENSTESSTIAMNSSVLPITVTTNNPSYRDGDKILISGTTRDYIQGMPITVIIRNPTGNIIMIAQVPLQTDKTYLTSVQAGGSLWRAAGAYEVDVTFGTSDRSAKTTFQFTGSKVQTPPVLQNTIAVEETNVTIPFGITNGKILGMKIDTQSKSLLVAMQTTDGGVLTVTLPRALIDAKAGNQDDQYYVLLDGQESNFDEISTTVNERTLSIPFVDGTEEIEIMGTQVIPEFGLMASSVFVIAMLVIIVVCSKTGMQFMSRH